MPGLICATSSSFMPYVFTSFINAPPILDCLFSFLEITDIIHSSRTCASALVAVHKYMKRAFNLDRHFWRFFDRPHEFRHLLSRTRSVVAGSNALQFFTRSAWNEPSLDLYVYQAEAIGVAEWLGNEGYDFMPRKGQPLLVEDALSGEVLLKEYAYEMATYGLIHVLDFQRQQGAHIRVLVCSPKILVLDLIFNLHSTGDMNVITHKAAYCFYPLPTLHHRESVFFGSQGDDLQALCDKYHAQGWKTIRWHDAEDASHFNRDALYARNIRYLGDKHCWTIKYEPAVSAYEEDPLTKVKWKLGEYGPERLLSGMGFMY